MATTIEAPELSRTTVGQAMHRGVFTCRGEASALTAARVMAAHRVHSVVVVDDNGSCIGVVTEADIAAAIHAGTIMERSADVGAAPVLVTPDDSVLRAAQLMDELERTHALVVDARSEKPVGVLSVLDLVDLLVEDL